MMKTLLAAVLAGLTVLVGSQAAVAAPAKKHQTLIAYTENRSLHIVDGNQPGIDHGDLFHRENAVSWTRGGPVIGVSYSQAEVISHNPDSDVDVRRVFLQVFLPKGRMYFMGTSELARGTVPPPGWKNHYAILGGTGKYAGARGTMTLTLLPDGKTFRAKATYTLD